MVSQAAFEQFAKAGAVWLVLAVLWAAASLWADRDAREGIPRAAVWRTFFLVLGAAFFLATWRFGLQPLAAMLVLQPLGLLAYGLFREMVAPEDSRLLPPALARQLGGLAERLGIGTAIDRWQSGRGTAGSGGSGPPRITLLKKNGEPYDSKDAEGVDHDTSRAIRALQGILLTALSFWATAFFFDAYSPKIVLLAGLGSLAVVAAVVKAIMPPRSVPVAPTTTPRKSSSGSDSIATLFLSTGTVIAMFVLRQAPRSQSRS